MAKTDSAVRIQTDQNNSHSVSESWLATIRSGTVKSPIKPTPMGIAPATMKGCRRPQRLSSRSDQVPMTGSDRQSKITATASATPAAVPDRPSTCV